MLSLLEDNCSCKRVALSWEYVVAARTVEAWAVVKAVTKYGSKLRRVLSGSPQPIWDRELVGWKIHRWFCGRRGVAGVCGGSCPKAEPASLGHVSAVATFTAQVPVVFGACGVCYRKAATATTKIQTYSDAWRKNRESPSQWLLQELLHTAPACAIDYKATGFRITRDLHHHPPCMDRGSIPSWAWARA